MMGQIRPRLWPMHNQVYKRFCTNEFPTNATKKYIRCIVHEFPTNTTKYKIDSSIDLAIKRGKKYKDSS
jgi:hypothetical protein